MRLVNKVKVYIVAAFDLVDSFLYDIWRYWRFSQAFARFRSRESGRFYLLMTAHTLEKGLALPLIKPGFGVAKCRTLMSDVSVFQAKFGADPVCGYVSEVLSSVLKHHQKTGASNTELLHEYEKFASSLESCGATLDRSGGAIQVTKKDIAAKAPADPFGFFSSRRSVRQFADTPIPAQVIREAVRIAQCSPSVCNRQSSRIYYSSDRTTIARALELQRGGVGFGETAGAVFVVTSDLSAFNRAGERNQSHFDSGLFAMSFALGLHALGFGTCFLNWSKTARDDRRFREAFDIPASETIMTLLVGGSLRDSFSVAASPRMPTDDILRSLHAL